MLRRKTCMPAKDTNSKRYKSKRRSLYSILGRNEKPSPWMNEKEMIREKEETRSNWTRLRYLDFYLGTAIKDEF